MITGVILTHNEEQHVVACIEHLRPYVAEILLVDTESTDRTVELARPLVDRVLPHPHVPNFDSARNLAIPEASHEWLWFVDADERVPELTGQLVNQWIREHGAEFEAINIPFKSYFCGRWMRHCGWWPGYTCPRVLKRGFFEFSSTLHGGVKLTGRELRAPADERVGIEHYSFRDLAHWVEKANRYTSTEALQLAKQGINYDWRGALRFLVHDLWEHYELHNARLDGERGWILTWCAAMYRWLSVAKLIDHGRSPEQQGGPSSVPADLDEFLRAFEQELAAFRAERPVLPLDVVWRGPVWEASAAAEESRRCILNLAAGPRAVTVEPLAGGTTAQLPTPERALLRALARARRGRSVATITQWSPRLTAPDRCASYNVLRVPREADVTPAAVRQANAYDQLWVESHDQVRGLIEAGAAPERIAVVSALCDESSSERSPGSTSTLENLLLEIDNQFVVNTLENPPSDKIRVQWEGEFFAGHSFSNINEQLAQLLTQQPGIALSLRRVRHQRTDDRRTLTRPVLAPYFERPLGDGPNVTIRHAYPPNWQRPAGGKWVHIQPWEFGSLPNDWVQPLRDDVDEIWVMSRYVERVYKDSGIAPAKIHYLPWGVDPAVFRPDGPVRRLPTEKPFRFLYVGGTIFRKGFDRLLAAYLAEFTSEDDVCLVIKDVGTSTFYQPQSMREQIHAAQADPTNPAIVYFDEEMTPGQLAALYRSCQCLVAPYRGEGFGLPILESLACGVPPIVPSGGPTDDFVDAESGFLLGSRFVPAEGVSDLCGPALELEIEPAELRSTMRRACEDQSHTRQLGLAGSERIRREFTWENTARDIVKRLQTLTERTGLVGLPSVVVPPEIKPEGPPRLLLAAVVRNAEEPALLVETLARLSPFVTSVFVEAAGNDPRIRRLTEEYGATIVEKDEAIPETGTDWILSLHAGEYLDEEELDELKTWLQHQPDSLQEASFLTDRNDVSLADARVCRASPRVNCAGDAGVMQSDRTPPPAQVPLKLRRAAVAEVCSELAGNDRGPPRGEPMPSPSNAVGEPSALQGTPKHPAADGDRCGRPYGLLKKSVLIQMACGAHLDLLELTRDHHRQYAERHGLDYWCITGNPAPHKRPGWGKVPLLLAGIRAGYESVIWLDADAVIVQPQFDLTALVPDGMGMVRHPHPEHWNTGLIVARSGADVERFWQAVDDMPDNNHAWMEQAAANELADLPEFAWLMHPLDLRFNSVPGFAMAADPVVVAAHGLPAAQRRLVLERAMAKIPDAQPVPVAESPRRRDDFGLLLNKLELTGEAVEVGVQRGEFAHQLLAQWQGRRLHLVDPWRHLSDYSDIANGPDSEHETNLRHTRDRLASYEGRYQIHRALSSEAIDRFQDESLDFVYLDANHSLAAVRDDLRLWFPKVKPGGILAGHDFLDGNLPEGQFGVATAVRQFADERNLALQLTDDPPWLSWYVFKH